MYLVFYLQACLVLVSANSLYEFKCCPNTYSSYGNDQPLVVQKDNYNPYLLSLLVPNSLNSIHNPQTVPHQYQSLNPNNVVPNYQFYNQNGLEILHVPGSETEKVINNYILIPQEYVHNNGVANERDKERRENKKNEIKTNKKNKNKNKSKSKRRRPNLSATINNDHADISNPDVKTTNLKESREEIDRAKSGGNKIKKNYNENNYNLLTDNVEPLPLKKIKNHEEIKTKYSKNHLISSYDKHLPEENTSPSNKPNYQQPKQAKGSTKKGVLKDSITDANIKSRKKDDTGFRDVNVCFDINEDCTDLNCRHTRNKDVNKKNKSQPSKPQQDLPNNFNNYMNGFTNSQQMNPNFFNPNVNFPFNFDYLYQMPQASNVKPKDSNNRRNNKKRKQPSSNRQTNLNKKNKSSITIAGSCNKVVELNPEVIKIETTTLTPQTTITTIVEPEIKNVIQEEVTLEKDQVSNLENPIPPYTETLFTEVSNNDKSLNNKNAPFINDNDLIDDYYPDFTLDNIYISSKEDYDFGNFHDRYYYAYGDKHELNRDRRKYDPPNGNKLNFRKLNRNDHNKITLQESSQIKEVTCKTDTLKDKVQCFTPPVVEFPGFKTEMINKEKYFAENRENDYDVSAISTTKKFSAKQAEVKENRNNNNVEMVFANSKVVRYGAEKGKEIIPQDTEPEIKNEFKNLISNDGKTTVVIAKSLDYVY